MTSVKSHEAVRSPIEFIEYIIDIGILRHIRDMGALEAEAREIVRQGKLKVGVKYD